MSDRPRGQACGAASVRAVVVGGGAVGLATACELGRRGWSVTVVDAGEARPGASRISFARVNASEKTRRDYFELNAAGMAAFRSLAATRGAPPWLHLTGHLEWASTPERRRRLRARTRLVESWGYSVAVLSGEDVKARLEPDLVVPDDEEVSFFADEGYVETHGLLGELRHTAEALGIEVRRDSRVTGIATPGDRARGVELETGELLPADVVVCAAGRWTGEVAALAGASVPLLGPEDARVAGFLATTTPTATSLSRSVFSPRLNLRPDGGGKLVLQAFDLDADAFADAVDGGAAGVAVELAHRLEEILRLPAAVDVEELRVGVRALPVDGFPIVGWAEGVEGVYVVASHSGVTLCLVLGRLAAAEIAEGRAEPLLDPFRPERFARPEEPSVGVEPTAGAITLQTMPGDHVDHLIEQWGDVLPSLDVSPMAVIARISRLCRILERDVDAIYAEYGLNHAQFGVLAALRRSGPPYRLSPTELYNSLLITSGAVTNRLERLTTAGLVKRVGDPSDGRSLLVALTPKGLRLIDHLVELHYEREAELLRSLSTRERDRLAGTLRDLLLALEGDGDPSKARRSGATAEAATARSTRRRRGGSGRSRTTRTTTPGS